MTPPEQELHTSQRLHVKPLSVNEAYRGRRFSTPSKKAFDRTISFLLKKGRIYEGPLEIHYTFGLSSVTADVDNCIKVFQDCLQKRYGFNDSRVWKIVAEKVKVEHGDEFIDYIIYPYSK